MFYKGWITWSEGDSSKPEEFFDYDDLCEWCRQTAAELREHGLMNGWRIYTSTHSDDEIEAAEDVFEEIDYEEMGVIYASAEDIQDSD